MPIPTYDRCIEPVLRYLAKHSDGAPVTAVQEAVADQFKITAKERLLLLPSGVYPVYKSRIGWAHDRLKRAGYSTSVRRGFWRLTEEGVAFAKATPTLSEATVQKLATVPRGAVAAEPSSGATAVAVGIETDSPEERIERAVGELRDSVARDLLDQIGQASPAFFERLVLQLLHAMGYGASQDDLQRLGGAGDGGVDGVISLDRLGLEKVYVQAKRWKGRVGPSEIRGFMGALQLQGATKGVFLTTGTYSADARDTASRARGGIVLIDGERLARLMIDHDVGVSKKALQIARVDTDFFDEA